jgi:hypothetical protein
MYAGKFQLWVRIINAKLDTSHPKSVQLTAHLIAGHSQIMSASRLQHRFKEQMLGINSRHLLFFGWQGVKLRGSSFKLISLPQHMGFALNSSPLCLFWSLIIRPKHRL